MAAASAGGSEKIGQNHPAPTKKNPPKPNYLSQEDAEALARQLCKIPITDCRLEDLTYGGLLRVLNRRLRAAGRPEKVYWDLPAQEIFDPESIERDIKNGNPWGPYSKAKGKLDRKKLVEEINRGSVYDLINNITLWICNTTGCFKDGISIQGGENWPHLEDRMGLYPMTFR